MGTSCGGVTTTTVAPAAAAASLYPNPLRTGDAALSFTLTQAAGYEVALCDLRGVCG